MQQPVNEPQAMESMHVEMDVEELEHGMFSIGERGDTTQERGHGGVREPRHYAKRTLTALERKKSERARKARQLHRFRKWLIPKNAIVALHELQGPGMAEFTIITNGQQTKAEIIINNVKYEATAPNKNLAKAKASEKALRDLVLTQMMRLKQQRLAGQAAATAGAMDGVEVNPQATDSLDSIETEDLPMEHLASFALYKLFTQWEAEGFEMPFTKTTRPKAPQAVALADNGAGTSFLPKVVKTVADLPENARWSHPTVVFAYMRPQIAYEELGSINDPMNREFMAGLRTDGLHFIGKGRSKKLARKAAAVEACKILFGLEFDENVLNG
ncbi:uncharacterized protein LOC128306363 isoform X2 [Anopheles moucheti]|uniref:uncharacterized protein LOC128306363 isoform X2 n=1 Tax=Anopheles moucheti TaxID=186751 RepID=UPI0022F04000|nr:uncharacterized protein LOC128306363 isoform X2 [Anopheles moucheti]